jgi:hypothetical protein
MKKQAQKQENMMLRSALQLINLRPDDKTTHIDLAIAADSKVFLGQPQVGQFINRLWHRESSNGEFCDALLPASPRQKWRLATCGHVIFLALHLLYVGSNIEPIYQLSKDGMQVSALEAFFWFWAVAYLGDEFVEICSNLSNLGFYLRGSGNANDLAIIACMLVGLVTRLVTVFAFSKGVLVTMFAALALGFIFSAVRLLHMLTVYEELGTMEIITHRILLSDIAPFLVFAVIIVAAFEMAFFFFGWLRTDDGHYSRGRCCHSVSPHIIFHSR